MTVRALVASAGVFVGCFSSMVFLEHLIKYDPGAGNLITFAQFLFIAIEGFLLTSKFGQQPRMIGLMEYTLLVIMFFMTSVCNNYAFDLNIPMPLHMVFRGGSLISNMAMGIIVFKRRYRIRQYISVILISLGIFLCTYYSSRNVDNIVNNVSSDQFWWLLGILLLVITLLVSSYMGIRQEIMYRSYGKSMAREALYYTHLLPLPGFIFLYKNISEHFKIIMDSESVIIISNISGPIALFYLVGNVLAQYICIRSVYTLTTECTSLTVTLILTLRKFVSLIFSILYFKNPFTFYHWMGALLVFIGTLIFSDIVVDKFVRLKRIVKLD